MAEDSSKDQRVGMLKKFFPGSAAESPAPSSGQTTASNKAAENRSIIREPRQMQQVIEIAANNGSSISVHIPGEKNNYTTQFASTTAADFKTADGSLCLMVSPLDPPVGNIKIRGSTHVIISFFTDLYIAEAKVSFIKFLEDRSIQLSFPREMVRGDQKRSSSRVRVDPKAPLNVIIKRPSGFTFTVKIFDISAGGVAFYSDETIPPMLENTRLSMIISRPAQRDIEVITNVLGVMSKEGKTCYRGTFIHRGDSQKEIDRLIQSLLDKIREKRQKLFNS